MKNSVIIVLKGRANCGKSATIKYVADELSLLGAEKLFEKTVGDDIIAEYSYGRRTIGIISAGDSAAALRDAFGLLPHRPDVCLMASRNKGDTVDFINAEYSSQTIMWHTKWIIDGDEESCQPLYVSVNRAQAKGLAEILAKA